MKKLALILLPPLVAFGVFAVILKYNPLQYTAEALADIGSGSLGGLIVYFKTFSPLLLVIAVLSQVLIGIPLWRGIKRSTAAAFWTILIWLLVCLIISAGLSYIIWDHATGFAHFMHINMFMFGVQSIYWLLDFALLWLMDRPRKVDNSELTMDN